MRRRDLALRVVLAGVVSVLSSSEVRPQAQPGSGLPFLLTLPGQQARVLYTPGSLDRAAHLQMRLELLSQDFSKWSGTKVQMGAVVLEREGWIGAGFQRPYGFPVRFGSNVAVAAWGDPGTVALWRRLLGGVLPGLPGMPLRGTAEEAASLVMGDLLAQVETGRMFLQIARLSGEKEWINEVFCHVVSLNAFFLHEAPRLPDIAEFYQRLQERGGGPRALALSGYRSDLPEAQWLWFQAQFFQGAQTIFNQEGKKAVKRLLKLRGNSARVSASELLGRYPDLRGWLASSFAQEPASADSGSR